MHAIRSLTITAGVIMSTIRQRLGHSSLLGLSLSLAACAGQTGSASLRPMPLTRFAASASTSPEPAPDTTVAVRAEAPPLETRRYATIEEMLTGRVAGLAVYRRNDGTVSLRVRGLGATADDAEPLLVVDGMMMSTSSSADMLASLSAMRIERIDVLKDVAATAIYGSRGAHGVVMITTRRAQR
jgi:TonB-dependent SusC/RagA subfamily outer membrane receptor